MAASSIFGILNNTRVRTRIYGAFGIILALMGANAASGVVGLSSGRDGLASFVGIAQLSNLVRDIEAQIIEMRLSVQEYIVSGNDAKRTEAESQRFACNAVVVGQTVVTNSGCDELAKGLRQWGYDPVAVELDEFLKAGGSAKCLTIRLDGEEAAEW